MLRGTVAHHLQGHLAEFLCLRCACIRHHVHLRAAVDHGERRGEHTAVEHHGEAMSLLERLTIVRNASEVSAAWAEGR